MRRLVLLPPGILSLAAVSACGGNVAGYHFATGPLHRVTCPSINSYQMNDAELRACRLYKIPLMRVKRLPDGGTEYDYGRRRVQEWFRLPPPGFHILTASNARLRFYGLPERPPTEPNLTQWKGAMRDLHLVRPGRYLIGGKDRIGLPEGASPRELGGPPPGPSAYTVTRTADGVQLSVHFERPSYPAHALIPVTATLRNLSHRHLYIASYRLPYGICNAPSISVVSVNSKGVPAEPVPPIPAPAGKCAAAQPDPLPVGQTFTEHQLVVLWTPRLGITAHFFNVEAHIISGFDLRGPSARFSLYKSPAPTIKLGNEGGQTIALVTPPPGTAGTFYYQSWGRCRQSWGDISALYWKARQDPVVPAICAHPIQWHLDVAWLNWPVASLNLGAGKR